MNKILQFLKTIRFANLIMLVLVQAIVSLCFVEDFQVGHYLLITSSTVLIALAAYLLNDIQDIEIDQINQKLRLINQNNKPLWFKIVFVLNVVGLSLGFWASYLAEPFYFFYFLLAVILLTAYAFFFSKYKFIGNLIISFLISLSILLCFYLEEKHPYFERIFYSSSEYSLWVYAACAFMLNWLREIIKDMEDIIGDKLVGRLTIPILLGMKVTKFFSGIILIFFVILFVFSAKQMKLNSLQTNYLILLSFLSFLGLISLFFSHNIKQFARTSLLIKILMLASLLLPFLF